MNDIITGFIDEWVDCEETAQDKLFLINELRKHLEQIEKEIRK